MSSGSPSKAEGREHVKLSEEPAGREADALAALGSAEGEWEVHLGGDPRQKLVSICPSRSVVCLLGGQSSQRSQDLAH